MLQLGIITDSEVEMIDTGKFSKTQVDEFLSKPLLARLSTAVPRKDNINSYQPHTTPVWFYWDGESLYISAFQSTRKVKEVKRNPYIAVLIDVPEAIDGVTAILFEGRAELILNPQFVNKISRVIYTRYMGDVGVIDPAPQSWMVDPDNSIIKLTPTKLFTW